MPENGVVKHYLCKNSDLDTTANNNTMSKNNVNNLIWLVDTINRNGKISFADINDKWRAGDKERKDIPLRTFHNHRRDIEDMFDINIECEKSTNRYYVDDAEGLYNSKLKMWLLNSFSLNNILQESIDLKRRVIFEDIPSGLQYIEPLTDAMRKGVQVVIKYQTYYWPEPRNLTIDPYFLRLFHQRWYLMGVNSDNPAIHSYALDRIQDLKISNTKFKYPRDFDPKEFYKDCFGIIKDDELGAKRTLIRATASQSNYLRNLPLHESQQEIDRTEEFSLFEMKICPTYDLCQQLLSLGEAIEVLEPVELRSMMREHVKKMGQIYGK